MDFMVVVGVIAVFSLGLIVVIEGFLGRDARPPGQGVSRIIFGVGGSMRDPNRPEMKHPLPGPRRVRQMAAGFALMVLAVVAGAVLI